MGQSGYSPIWAVPFFVVWVAGLSTGNVAAVGPALLILIVFASISRKRLIVVTDRCAYQFQKRIGSNEVKPPLQQALLGEVAADCGFTWALRLGEGPRVFATFDSGIGVRKRVAALINQSLGETVDFTPSGDGNRRSRLNTPSA